jgi:hypothetical protein
MIKKVRLPEVTVVTNRKETKLLFGNLTIKGNIKK